MSGLFGDVRCPWHHCRCTHTEGCVAGWIDGTDETGKEWARPCPTCRPELARHLVDDRYVEDREGAMAAARKLPRPSREVYEGAA